MQTNKFAILNYQKNLMDKTSLGFNTQILNHGESMVSIGSLKPLDITPEYQIKIEFFPNKSPKVFILKPEVPIDPKIHIYRNGSLCLFYPIEFQWKSSTSITQYLIPWINEWIIYYEIFKITGVWEGPEAPHLIK